MLRMISLLALITFCGEMYAMEQEQNSKDTQLLINPTSNGSNKSPKSKKSGFGKKYSYKPKKYFNSKNARNRKAQLTGSPTKNRHEMMAEVKHQADNYATSLDAASTSSSAEQPLE